MNLLKELMTLSEGKFGYDFEFNELDDSALQMMITEKEKSIKNKLDAQGWNKTNDIYNRDWKKDLSEDKKILAALKKELASRKKPVREAREPGDNAYKVLDAQIIKQAKACNMTERQALKWFDPKRKFRRFSAGEKAYIRHCNLN